MAGPRLSYGRDLPQRQTINWRALICFTPTYPLPSQLPSFAIAYSMANPHRLALPEQHDQPRNQSDHVDNQFVGEMCIVRSYCDDRQQERLMKEETQLLSKET